MTDIIAATGTAQTNTSASDTARVGLADDFETFLTLLTEQLKNQDPLSPLDSNEFVSQLVQFSGVEQQINQTSKLEELIALQANNNAGAAVSYLGRTVEVNGDTAPLSEGSARWSYDAVGASSVSYAISDDRGRVVASGVADPGRNQSLTWDGLDARGEALPDGAYTLSIAALDTAGEAVNTSVRAFGTVSSIDLSSTTPSLFLGPVRVDMSAVRTLQNS